MRIIKDEEYGGFKWISGSSYIHLFQNQGLDIGIIQGNNYPSFTTYSDPAHEIFVSLISYLKQNNNTPKLEDIASINGIPSKERNVSLSTISDTLLKNFCFQEKLPCLENDKIIIKSMNFGEIGGNLDYFYQGYTSNNNYVIGIKNQGNIELILNEKKISTIKPIITLNQNDALNIIKGIYFFSPNNALLKELCEKI